MDIRFNLVNAFSCATDGGNLAGVVLDASDLDDSQMQAIATKIGASETAFVLPSETETYRLRFFTPSTEVSMCGHATIAAWYLLAEEGRVTTGCYTQETSSGKVMIEVAGDSQIFMAMTEFNTIGAIPVNKLAGCLGLSSKEFSVEFEPRIVSSDLIIKVISPKVLRSIDPDFESMIDFSERNNFDAFHVFCDSTDEGILAEVRSFAPRVGINEDAATGTGNSGMLYLLSKRNLLASTEKTHKISQGALMGHPSCIIGRVEGSTVWVGGNATVLKLDDDH